MDGGPLRRAERGVMKTLSEHNEERKKQLIDESLPHGNGIACPRCGKELFDKLPMLVLTSSPPQRAVHCRSCGYSDYRIL